MASDPGLNSIGRGVSLVVVTVVGTLVAGLIVATALVIGTAVSGAINRQEHP